ncbi:flagellar basal-body rod protein FlgF [Polymorphobacter glacialis]|uniref:Flagellar basal-body rod protein FlgF n=1 Tax=Sandarakinorhabdus glacialis TaxID=1614636 RepID=A0A917E3T4_9SPHN|nr:flagellar hook-basal body complex protein [Polymorphobacter glacialis]GGE02205.1 flagellar basal-body rod protein FlgF [Polymorphobacter glacialis]
MDRVIYTVLTGLSAQARAQSVTANNLANAGTTGFRREIIAAEGRYLTESRTETPTARSRAQAGAPSLATPNLPGKLQATGRQLDIALQGDAWLAVEGRIAGTEAYTRRGDLGIGPTGLLQTGDGHPVLNQASTPIAVPPGSELQVAPDGTLTTRTAAGIVALGQLKLVAGAALKGLDKGPDNQFTSAIPLPADPSARLAIGSLENSNVETAGALVELTEQSRGFEISARLLGVAKDIDERTARLMAFDSQ